MTDLQSNSDPTPIDFLVPFDELITVHRSLDGDSWNWHCRLNPNSAMCTYARRVPDHNIAVERGIEHLERSHHILQAPTLRGSWNSKDKRVELIYAPHKTPTTVE